ncbi:MAG: hypothetical protein KDB23_34400, partial [Planctomycetales bacterium]|nr:hypothetical protein [Planctomycetales bacterium]
MERHWRPPSDARRYATDDDMIEAQNIFQWLDLVRARRSMFVHSLAELECMICGYYSALDMYHISE